MSSSDRPDLRIDDHIPVDDHSAEGFHGEVELSESELRPLATHHAADGRDSFLVLHDGTMTWGTPGSPQLLAVHITRDPDALTFRYASRRLPLVALAQQWLIARGCPPDAIDVPADRQGAQPADTTTTALETRLRTALGRYELLDHHTNDGVDPETTVVLRDTDPGSAQAPYRVLVEGADLGAFTYTLREGAFPTAEAADEWLRTRGTPLPAPPPAAAPPKPRGRGR